MTRQSLQQSKQIAASFVHLCILADLCPFVLSLEQSGMVGHADLIGEDESSFEQPVFMKSADFICRSVLI